MTSPADGKQAALMDDAMDFQVRRRAHAWEKTGRAQFVTRIRGHGSLCCEFIFFFFRSILPPKLAEFLDRVDFSRASRFRWELGSFSMNDLCKKWIQSRIEKLYQREEEDLNNTRSVKISQNQRFEKIPFPPSTKIRNILSTHYLSTLETDRIKMDSILNEAPQLSSFLLDLEAWFTKIGGGWPSSARVHRIFRMDGRGEGYNTPWNPPLFPLAAYALFPACVHTEVTEGGRREKDGRKKHEKREREGSKHEGAEGWSGVCKSKVFYSLNIGPNQTPSARANINALHLVYIIMGVWN